MTKNPIINGLSASAYIFLVVTIISLGAKLAGNRPDTFIVPVAMISLFTLSAAVMGFIFGYQPLQLYFDNNKKQAVKLFLQTVLVFAFITAVVFVLLFTGVF